MSLTAFGWTPHWQTHFTPHDADGLAPGRVISEHRNAWFIATAHGELLAEISGRLRHDAQSRADLPAVGDWVAAQCLPAEGKAVIRAILPRRSHFRRLAAGARTEQQVLAANVDTVFLVSGLDGDFNLRRIERYLTQAWESGASPVILLNKADLCPDVERRVAQVRDRAVGAPVHVLSAARHEGLDELRPYLAPGKTVVFLGSSGVGKSSIVNALLGEERLATNPVREHDSRGRHTTTRRELFLLPGGALVIDTPGLREIKVWGDESGLRQTFEDVEAFARDCRFRDCSHTGEAGCGVRAAIERGELSEERLESYQKLQRELARLAHRQGERDAHYERLRWKSVSRQIKRLYKGRDRGDVQ
jgi:ribosome biogenesis GTPase